MTNKLVLLSIMTVVCVFVTLLTCFYLHVDVVYTHLFYIPILLAGFWYNKKAIYVAMFLGVVHIVVSYDCMGHFSVTPWLRTVMFCTVAFTVGSLSEKKEKLFRQISKSEIEFRLLFDSSRDAIMTLAPPSWKFTSGNSAALKMFGVKDKAEFAAFGPWVLSPERQPDGSPSIEKAREMIETTMREGSCFFEWTHKRLSGENFPANVLLSRMTVDEQVFVQATVRDITERKQAEEKLEQYAVDLSQANELWQNTFNAVEHMMFVLDQNFVITLANKAMQKAFPGKSVIGTHCYELFHCSDDPSIHCPVKETLDTGKFAHIEKYQEDMGKWLDIYTYPVMDKNNNKLDYIIHVAKDVTQEKKNKQILQQYATNLKQANEEVKQFAYIVSHDLRAPLINLKGFASELRESFENLASILRDIIPKLDKEQAKEITTALETDIPEDFEFIDSSTSHMDNFINALLKLSRMGHRELEFEPINLMNVFETVLKSLARQIKEHRTYICIESLPEIIADRTAVEQVLGNILTNSLKYLDPDRPGKIEITGEQDEKETTIRIKDNGRGIAPEDMHKVFAPFRRAGKQDTQGEGMGLAYVQSMVARHHGQIRCESQPDVGTTFIVTLPNNPSQGDENVLQT